MYKKALIIVGLSAATALAGCTAADVASTNLSTAADNFEIPRRISVINGITDNVSMVMEGYCSLGNNDKPGRISITCKLDDGQFVKNFLDKSDNTFVLTEQLASVDVSTFQYRTVLRPQSMIPDFDFQGDAQELINPSNTDG